MGRLCRFILTIAAFATLGLATAPVSAKNIGADPPLRCSSCGCGCSNGSPKGPSGNCSASEPCNAGACFSRTEGNLRETYPVVAVKSSTGAMLDLSLTYDSYNADTSRARFNTVLGIGWTHSYNFFLFSQVGSIYRADGDGRVTKYQLGPGGTYTAARGYFETIVKNPDGSFTITDKNKTVTRYMQIAGTPFMQGTPVWRLASITDRNNNVTTLTYSAGNLTKVTDTYGRTITFTYNSRNLLTSLTDPLRKRRTMRALGTVWQRRYNLDSGAAENGRRGQKTGFVLGLSCAVFGVKTESGRDQTQPCASRVFLAITKLASANRVRSCAVFLARPR